MRIVIATIKSWNIENAQKFIQKHQCQAIIVSNPSELDKKMLDGFQPDYIFFPHWSWIIPEEIFECWDCVVFHMTALPFGRGGSPLQNLILRGYKETTISAIKAIKQVDAGPIYWQESLSLQGSAEDILKRASQIIFFKIMPKFMESKLIPQPQAGEVVVFKRRQPADSEMGTELNLEAMYDYIRMLDAEGYPNAFILYGNKRLSFKHAKLNGNKIVAEVEIQEEEN